jgi:hypothetical protein
MKVEINKYTGVVLVTKEKGDPVFRNSGWALAESTFLYHVKKELEKQGYDCIKKRMSSDGHMMDDEQQYIRDRKWKWYIYNGRYATFDAGMEFNERGVVDLYYNEFPLALIDYML